MPPITAIDTVTKLEYARTGYFNDGNTVSIFGIGNHATTGALIIPSTVTDGTTTYPVVAIGETYAIYYSQNPLPGFTSRTGLTSVTIPSSVTFIGYKAFYACTGLTSVTFDGQSSVTLIDNRAFYGCNGLTSVTIPNSVTTINSNAFAYCKKLTSVTIPSNVTSGGSYAFAYCIGLTSVTISSSFAAIEWWYGFAYCTALTSVTFGNNVTNIGTTMFSGCTALTSVTIPSSVTGIGGNAFFGCTALEAVYFLGNVIASNLQFNVTSTKIYVTLAATGWGSTFSGCSVIKVKISDPPTAASIILDQTLASSTLTGGSATVPGTFSWFDSSIVPRITEPQTAIYIPSDPILKQLPYSTGLSTPVIVTIFPSPRDTDTLLDYSLSGNDATIVGIGGHATIGLLNIPSTVTDGTTRYPVVAIGASAFINKTGLTSVKIPASVTSIGTQAFLGCSGVVSAYFLGNVIASNSQFNVPSTTIYVTSVATGWGTTFSGCTVTQVKISTSPTASSIFANQSLTSSTLTGGSASVDGAFSWLNSSTVPGVTGSQTAIFIPTDTILNQAPYLDGLSTPVTVNILPFPRDTDTLLEYSFSGNDATILGIGGHATTGSLIIPSIVTYGITEYQVVAIGAYAFSGSGLSSVEIRSGIIIREGAFSSCIELLSSIVG